MENRINKVLTLRNGKKYVVLNQAIYKQNNYFFVFLLPFPGKCFINNHTTCFCYCQKNKTENSCDPPRERFSINIADNNIHASHFIAAIH